MYNTHGLRCRAFWPPRLTVNKDTLGIAESKVNRSVDIEAHVTAFAIGPGPPAGEMPPSLLRSDGVLGVAGACVSGTSSVIISILIGRSMKKNMNVNTLCQD